MDNKLQYLTARSCAGGLIGTRQCTANIASHLVQIHALGGAPEQAARLLGVDATAARALTLRVSCKP